MGINLEQTVELPPFKNTMVIDFDKMQSLDDIKLILKSIEIKFDGDNTIFEDIKHLLKQY